VTGEVAQDGIGGASIEPGSLVYTEQVRIVFYIE
jgi:hypothetical protein